MFSYRSLHLFLSASRQNHSAMLASCLKVYQNIINSISCRISPTAHPLRTRRRQLARCPLHKTSVAFFPCSSTGHRLRICQPSMPGALCLTRNSSQLPYSYACSVLQVLSMCFSLPAFTTHCCCCILSLMSKFFSKMYPLQ